MATERIFNNRLGTRRFLSWCVYFVGVNDYVLIVDLDDLRTVNKQVRAHEVLEERLAYLNFYNIKTIKVDTVVFYFAEFTLAGIYNLFANKFKMEIYYFL